METIYNVDYFIKKFEVIHETRWIDYLFEEVGPGILNHCAIGWCRKVIKRTEGVFMPETSESFALGELFLCLRNDVVTPAKTNEWFVTTINDGTDPRYQQDTPKQRILAALYDIKKLQEPEVKERIVYVTVDAKVRELQKEEIICN